MSKERSLRITPVSKKVIFFDMNGTLLDMQRTFRSSFLHVLQEFTGRLHSEEHKLDPQAIYTHYKETWGHLSSSNKAAFRPKKELQIACLRQTLKPYPFELTDAFLSKFICSVHEAQAHHMELYPGVKNTLTALSKDYTLALISNSKQHRQQVCLTKLGLTSLFPEEHLFTPDRAKYRKPNPKLFKYALRHMNIKPSEAVMVGDSWKHDIRGAAGVGMDAVWINHGAKKESASRRIGKSQVVTVNSFKKLLQLL